MGQYYRLVDVDKREAVSAIAGSWSLGSLKLCGSTHRDNGFTDLAATLLTGRWRGDRVMYVGDYAWQTLVDRPGRAEEAGAGTFRALAALREEGETVDPYRDESYADISDLVIVPPSALRPYLELRGEASAEPKAIPEIAIEHRRFVVDADKGVYYDRAKLPVSYTEEDASGKRVFAMFHDPLLILLAQGNGLGSGDYRHAKGRGLVGSWAFDEVYQSDERPGRLREVEDPFEPAF